MTDFRAIQPGQLIEIKKDLKIFIISRSEYSKEVVQNFFDLIPMIFFRKILAKNRR
jgi:hypothetical protein